MRVAGFIANRIAFNQQRSFSRFIIRLSIAATIISVAVMIITLAFVNGFQEQVSQKVFSFLGHLRIQEKEPFKALIAEETPIERNDSLVEAIRQYSEVQSIHPFATKYATLKTREDIEGVLVKGVDSTYDFSHFRQFILSGRPLRFNDSSYSREIMISAYTAKQLKLSLNDRILIYFIRPDGSYRPDRLTVSGIYKTGIEEYDKTFAIGDIKLIQRLNDWSSTEVGGYEIFLKDYNKMDVMAADIYNMDIFPLTWDTKTARDISPNIFDWLYIQNKNRNVLLGLMISVALINLVTYHPGAGRSADDRCAESPWRYQLDGATDLSPPLTFYYHHRYCFRHCIRPRVPLSSAGYRFYQTGRRSLLPQPGRCKDHLVAGGCRMHRHIIDLLPGADDTNDTGEKDTTRESNTVQLNQVRHNYSRRYSSIQ